MALTREQFVNEVIQVVEKRFPLVKISRGSEPFSMRVNGHMASLENLYRIVVLHPSDSQRHVERWMVELIRAAEGMPDARGTFDELQSRILPMVVADDGNDKRNPLTQPLIEGLGVSYALDNDRTIAYLTPDRLQEWGVNVDDLHEIALQNLLQRSQTLAAQAAQDENGKIYLIVFQTMDGYDASRILLPNLHENLSEYLGSPFAAAIPNRDILLCFRNDEETVEKLRPQVQSDFAQMPHQVCDRVLLVTADGIAPRS
jgi:uncharacterized protein YtpQ (UPF0354 family)